jgi:hypothetical protein
MAQHDYVIANGTGAAVRSDLNGALAAIVSNNSGATEPGTMYAYQWWPDTTTGLLKQRNSANSAWVTIGTLASTNLGLLPVAGGTMTGVIAVTAGTAALPGIAVSGDLNTGITSPGADQLAISTGGTSRLAVSTTAVSSTLAVDVPLGAVGTPSITFTGDLNTGIYSPGADQVAISTGGTQRLNADTAAVTSTLPVVHPLGAVGTPSITFTGDLNTGIWSPAADTIAFSEGGAEAMRIDSSSRLLVGTSTARNNFFNTAADANLQLEGAAGARRASIISCEASATAGGGLVLAHQRSGSVGGNTIVQNADVIGRVTYQGNDGTEFVEAASINCEVDGTPGANDMPGRLVFSTTADGASSPTERMRIVSSGQSLWGTTSTTGNAFASTATFGLVIDPVNGQILNCANGVPSGYFNRTGSDGSLFVFNRNGTEKGNIAVTTIATTYNSVSDYRLKENVTLVSDGIARFKQLKPSRFNFISHPDHTVDGFIAHEAQAVVPECVTGTKDAVDADGNPIYQGIDQSKLVPLLTAALQEAIAKIEALETRLSALEAA